jgi:glycine hydroxymethyltransferase
LDLTNLDVTGQEAEGTLDKAGITVNKNTIPFETKSPVVTSGIRIGTPTVTTRGMKEPEMETIAEMIVKLLTNMHDEVVFSDVRKKVQELCNAFPAYPNGGGLL